MFVVDTNVLVYAADIRSPYHGPCLRWLESQRARPDAWYSTWPILYEFLRVATHPRVLRRPWRIEEAWGFVKRLLASPGFDVLVPTGRHEEIASEVFQEVPHLAGNIVHDAHTAVLMREHGVSRICTRDTDFNRFRFLQVVDPVAAN